MVAPVTPARRRSSAAASSAGPVDVRPPGRSPRTWVRSPLSVGEAKP
ncbi:hypothetical protein [Luedemannella flava]